MDAISTSVVGHNILYITVVNAVCSFRCIMIAILEQILLAPRCFQLADSAQLEQASAVDRFVSSVARHSHESIVGVGISGTIESVLMQCSPGIFKVYCTTCSYVY